VEANPTAPLSKAAASLISIDEPNVLLVGARKATGSDGLLLRLWEVSGKPTTAHIRLGAAEVNRATAVSLVEDPQGPLEIRDGAIAAPIRGRGLASVIVE
jgi:hypothetical protein